VGREARCVVVVAGERAERTALLETDEVVLAGRPRVRLPFGSLRRVETRDGSLVLEGDAGEVVLELGAAEAERWAERIRHPPSLAARLGLKGQPVAVIGVAPPPLLAAIGTAPVVPPAEADVVFRVVGVPSELTALDELVAGLRADATLWVGYPKAEVREAEVLAAGRAAGLVDTRVARIDEIFTALRFSRRRS
jgi:hypothetical protein